MLISTQDIKKLRRQTGAGVMDVKRALEEAGGDLTQARRILYEEGLDLAEKKAKREASQGGVAAYIHINGRIGALVEVRCETDFVARTNEFARLCQDLTMQVTAMNPKNVEELLEQEYIRETSRKVKSIIQEVSARTGENILVKRFARYELGE